MRPRERRALRRFKRCAATPWHERRMRQLERKARRKHRAHRRERKREIRRMRCGSPECNQRLAAAKIPLSPKEHECRRVLNHRESGWEETAMNPRSGAYGIPQALPYTKLPPEGQPAAPNGWRKALAQLKWQLDYVLGRFGSYCAAIAFHNAHNWY